MMHGLFWTKYLAQNFDWINLREKGVSRGGIIPLWLLLTLKMKLDLSVSNQINPLQSLYNHPFYMKCLCKKNNNKHLNRIAFSIDNAIALPLMFRGKKWVIIFIIIIIIQVNSNLENSFFKASYKTETRRKRKYATRFSIRLSSWI